MENKTETITLVKQRGVPVTVGVGRFCFPLSGDKPPKVMHEFSQRAGARFVGNSVGYQSAYDLACWAWENQLFDNEENNQ